MERKHMGSCKRNCTADRLWFDRGEIGKPVFLKLQHGFERTEETDWK